MKRIWFKLFEIFFSVFIVGVLMFIAPGQVQAGYEAQARSGVYATVIYSDPINVRGGPSTVYYPVVGRVNPGDILPALGVSPGREWVQIAYPDAPGGVGWLYANYVSISGGELRVVEPPPTQTPIATATINPTFAAAFIFQPTSTRIPTFTPPPPLEIPQFAEAAVERPSGIAMGLVVIIFILLGGVVFAVSSILKRQ